MKKKYFDPILLFIKVERSKSLKFLDLYGFLRQGETFLSSNYDVCFVFELFAFEMFIFELLKKKNKVPTMKPIEVQIAESADLSSDGVYLNFYFLTFFHHFIIFSELINYIITL